MSKGRHWNTRKTHCKHGHEFTAENTRVRIGHSGNEVRSCLECERLASPLTGKPNVAEANAVKTRCPQGHEYTPENTIIDSSNGGRRCKICRREQVQRANKVQRDKRKRRVAT